MKRSACRRGGSRRSLPPGERRGHRGRGERPDAPTGEECGGAVECVGRGRREVCVHEDAITSGVQRGTPARTLKRGPWSSLQARMVRIRSARSSQSAWLTARTATCSAPCRSASATAVCARCIASLSGVSVRVPSLPFGSSGCPRRRRRRLASAVPRGRVGGGSRSASPRDDTVDARAQLR